MAWSRRLLRRIRTCGWPRPISSARLRSSMRPARINGLPGVILRTEDGLTTMAFEPDGEGRIAAIYIMRNPEKLGHLSAG